MSDDLPILSPAEARVLGATLKAGDSVAYEAAADRHLYLVPAAGKVGIGDVDDQQSRVRRLQCVDEPALHMVRRHGRQIDELKEKIAKLERVWEDFRTLEVGALRPEDEVFHELQDRFGLR